MSFKIHLKDRILGTPYWAKLLRHFEKKNYVYNGLTLPYIIGAGYLITSKRNFTIKELIIQMATYGATVMFCDNINEYVFGHLDVTTEKMKNEYKHFENLIVSDDCLDDCRTLQDVINKLESRYSDQIEEGLFSKQSDIWEYYSNTDLDHINEVATT